MVLRIMNLIKEFGKNNSYQKVLDDISTEFKSGEFVCLLGESGSGKSTFLNIIGGLDSKYEGSVTINNLNLKYIDIDNYRKENIGFIFQNFNLINSLSVIDNILLPIEKYKISYREKKKRAVDLLKKLNIYNVRRKRINELSGGQKQRIAIARALINNPNIILADEPTGALDEKNGESVLDILKEINEEGKLVIVVTHSKKVIDYSTRVINIKDGRIEYDKVLKETKTIKTDKEELRENKILYLINYGIRSLFNNKRRNFFIVLASSIGIIGIIISMFLGGSVKKYISDLILEKSNPRILNVVRTDNYSYYKDKDLINIKNIKHVNKVYEEISFSSGKLELNNKEYNLSFVDSFNKIDLEKGNDKGFVVNKYLYKKMGKNILGKEVYISLIDNYKVVEFYSKVTGVSKNSNISLLDENMHGYISYSNIKNIYKENDIKLYPNNISVKIDNKSNIDTVKKDLKKIKLKASNNNDLFNELNSYLNVATFVLSMFSSLSLIVSTIMISIIINITVIERTKEIGILRSIGYSKKNIKHIFNSEAISIGVMIGLFSSVVSSFLINITRDLVKDKFDISFNTNPNKYYLLGILISIFVTLLSSYFPSKKASNFDPVKSLKYE